MEVWVQVALVFGGLLTPIILAAFVRDRALMAMIAECKADAMSAIDRRTDDLAGRQRQASEDLHERINRVRHEFVRRDDFTAHMDRLEKQFDLMREELQRQSDHTDKRLDAILKQLQNRMKGQSDE